MAGYEMIDKAIDEQLDILYQHDFPIDAWIPLQHAVYTVLNGTINSINGQN